MLDLVKNNPAAIAEAGYEFTVVLPDGTETDASIKVRGVNSAIVKNYQRKLYQEYTMKEQAAKRRGKEVEALSPEESDQENAKYAAIRVIDWKGLSEDGQEIKFSQAEAERILLKYPFLQKQVMEASEDISNFRHS